MGEAGRGCGCAPPWKVSSYETSESLRWRFKWVQCTKIKFDTYAQGDVTFIVVHCNPFKLHRQLSQIS